MNQAATSTPDALPAAPIRMYVVEKVLPNGDVEIMAVELSRGAALHFAECGDDAAQCHIREAWLHYDRPRMAYGKIRVWPSLQRVIADEDESWA